MLDWRHLETYEARYEALTEQLGDPAVFADPARYRELAKEHAELEELVALIRELRRIRREMEGAETLRRDVDPEVRELAEAELERLRLEEAEIRTRLEERLAPRDPYDDRNVILEIRPGAGGEEAALFAGDLVRMYTRYAERKGWKVEILDLQPSDLGGVKSATLGIAGKGAYSRLKHESGVHRVQRVPVTEASGRIHTSTATVAVLPEAEEVEVQIRPEDLRIETFRSSGPGGQHMQKNETAVRITHIPTGIVVTCQDERSQHRNKEQALRILRAKLREIEERKKEAELRETRRRQIGSGERSEKIRTYNFPQNRVTDHRIDLTVYRLEDILEGDLDLIVGPLLAEEAARMLSED